MSRTSLIKAAEQLEKSAELLDSAAAQLDAATTSAEQAKQAAAKATAQAKTASAAQAVDKAALGQKAKVAAEAVRNAGLLSTPEMADQFAAELLDQGKAIDKIAKLAQHVAPKRASVVVDDSHVPQETADTNWDKTAAQVLQRLHLG